MNSEIWDVNPYRRTFALRELVSAHYFSTRWNTEAEWGNYPFSQIYLLLRGTATYQTETATYPMAPGMMCYAPSDTAFTFAWEGDVEFGLISFVCHSEAMALFSRGPILLGEEEQGTLLDVIKTAARICDNPKERTASHIEMFILPNTPDVVIGFIYASLERFLSMVYCRLCGISLLTNETQKASCQVDKSRLVADVKLYLEEHVTDRLTVRDVCTHFGIGQTALMKKFREETNQSLIEHFNDVKIGRAKLLVRNTTMHFGEIAEYLGFSSINYFSKMFKARTGMTLTAYSKLVSKRRASLE